MIRVRSLLMAFVLLSMVLAAPGAALASSDAGSGSAASQISAPLPAAAMKSATWVKLPEWNSVVRAGSAYTKAGEAFCTNTLVQDYVARTLAQGYFPKDQVYGSMIAQHYPDIMRNLDTTHAKLDKVIAQTRDTYTSKGRALPKDAPAKAKTIVELVDMLGCGDGHIAQ